MRIIRRQAGFTLVEIAIVLVIIGLLLGGILKGQEMITQARIKNVINDFNGISAAYFSYQDRYRAVPGDDSQAINRWATPLTGQNAPDSNGLLDVAGGSTATWNAGTGTPEPETRMFWWHLRLAGFIAGPTAAAPSASAQPTNAFGSLIGAAQGTGAGTLGLAGLIICSSGIPDKVAIAVDTQLDDQGAQTGTVRAIIGNAGTALAALPSGSAGTYAETGSNQYLMCKGL